MAIYADKKDGQVTGRWRVELQRAGERYRKRWDNHADAIEDEKRVLDAWARGESLKPAPAVQEEALPVNSLAATIQAAKGLLWDGDATTETNFARLGHIADILGKTTRLDEINTNSIDKLIQELAARGRAPATINRYLSHLRTFLVWAKKRGYRTKPVAGEDGISFGWKEEGEGRIRWITLGEEEKLKEYLPDNVWKLTKVAIETGCRRDELLTVEPGQINGTRLHLWNTKTKTPRTVPMSQETTRMLTELVKSKKMPTRRNLRSWWNRARTKMGLEDDKDFVFHACRHTRATRMVDAGINVFVIKEWMGHKRLETTLRYAHVKQQNLEDALVKVGDYFSKLEENPSIPTPFQVPHGAGGGGELANMSRAA
ncbi:hypothetical protein BSL82_03640 [Tardibacter chloracetimidivorans]|uniref:Integrase n=1 Tax=Tardibacter chloracetimidivorans TaxID=1921510 RepID=A0A1L3ZSB0_9SPHN|nr:site-specific integrase [Tardibacter chloracetimidivorans]API58509.1 hypothetical protein BSL82_03640 [Tardibacter chloracetimidivorans]